jgi:hypothetical protein
MFFMSTNDSCRPNTCGSELARESAVSANIIAD